MNEDTWTNRDLPVLRAAVRLSDESDMPVSASAIGRAVGFDEETTQRALRALYRKPAELRLSVGMLETFPAEGRPEPVGSFAVREQSAVRVPLFYRGSHATNLVVSAT